MNRTALFIISLLGSINFGFGQEAIPLDTLNWDINAKSYVFENYKGKDAIYFQAGTIALKDRSFLNGTIEYDIFLKEEQAFPGVYFRANDPNAEHFYIRPHLSGKPDANQVVALTNGVSAWQLNFGPKYSFPYDYKYDAWTHVKIVVNGNRAQVFLDHAEQPHLSWNLFHEAKAGQVYLTGGNANAMHIANIIVSEGEFDLINFTPKKRESIAELIPAWELSDKFEEELLTSYNALEAVIENRTWGNKIMVEEGTAANISRQVVLRDDTPGNTVFARITIHADEDIRKLFEFGYSDRVVVLLNNQPIYKGNNKYRSRDYRYLGTIGLFDAIYLDLKKGKNTLLLAVSEDFGGWLVTGKLDDYSGIKIE